MIIVYKPRLECVCACVCKEEIEEIWIRWTKTEATIQINVGTNIKVEKVELVSEYDSFFINSYETMAVALIVSLV